MDATIIKLMAKLFRYLMLVFFTTFSLTFVSCGGGDDDESCANNSTLFESLVWTSWEAQSVTFYDYSNNEVLTYNDSWRLGTITFTNLSMSDFQSGRYYLVMNQGNVGIVMALERIL